VNCANVFELFSANFLGRTADNHIKKYMVMIAEVSFERRVNNFRLIGQKVG